MVEITHASRICFNKTYKGKEIHKYIRIRVILLHTPAKFGRKIWINEYKRQYFGEIYVLRTNNVGGWKNLLNKIYKFGEIYRKK